MKSCEESKADSRLSSPQENSTTASQLLLSATPEETVAVITCETDRDV